MDDEGTRPRRSAPVEVRVARRNSDEVAATYAPIWLRPLLRLQSARVRTLVASLMILLGLAGQIVLLWAAAELLDLALSLMELWAELARKHLEITLSR